MKHVRGRQGSSPGGSVVRTGRATWIALLLLFLGLGLLDRGFAKWRNDPRNFIQANGTYRAFRDLTAVERAAISNPTVNDALMLSGVAALVVSVVLFGVAPFEGES